MRILFLCRHYTYFRNFESVLRQLAERGHELHLAVERSEKFGGTRLVESLVAEYPNITCETVAGRQDDVWLWTARRLRLGFDYLRYQHPLFDTAHKLRSRARDLTPGAFVALGDFVHTTGAWSRTLASRLLHRLERVVPEESAIRAFLEAKRPDVILVSPLIDLGSAQIDYLRAARALRIPTALCVWSWDNLSSKAIIRECPDRVFVWNETQKREAQQFHDVPAERVVVTGAQCFDQWFDRQPSRSREAFCAQVGLDADRPFLLYVCSALFRGSPPEANFVLEWIRHIRHHGSAALQNAEILVRPHPGRLEEWQGVDVTTLGAVLWGSNPVDAQAKRDYFDSLYHSAAVVGLNTSAFIEAGIVGRPVHTIVVPEFADNQTATVHFDYLLNVGGGLLNVAHTFDEHASQLDRALARPSSEVSAFVREFVRPHGLDRAATPIFVEQVEAMQNIEVEATVPDRLAPVLRRGVQMLARTRGNERLARWTLSARERESAEKIRELHRQKALQNAPKLAAAAAERQGREERRAAKLEQERQEKAAKAAARDARRSAKKAASVERHRADDTHRASVRP
jgi:hypothetical protein